MDRAGGYVDGNRQAGHGGDKLADAVTRLGFSYFDRRRDILALHVEGRGRRTLYPPKAGSRHVTKQIHDALAAVLIDFEIIPRAVLIPRFGAALVFIPSHAVAVIFRALALVGQQIIGRGDFLEPVGCPLIAGIDIGVQLFGQAAIGALDGIEIRVSFDPEQVVGVHVPSFVCLLSPVNRSINFNLSREF